MQGFVENRSKISQLGGTERVALLSLRSALATRWQSAQQGETTLLIAVDFLTEMLGCIAAILC